MLRLILSILFAVLYLIVTLPVLAVLAIVGLFRPKARNRAAMKMIRPAFRFLLFLAGVKLTVIGEDRIPKDTACLFVGNHRSIYDIITAYALIPSPAGIVAKESLKKIPIFSIWMKFICCLFLNRDDLRSGMEMIKQGTAYIEDGVSMYICPEGTRNKAAEDLPLLPFHEGSFRMATKANAPVVPVAINNAIQVWEAHRSSLRATHVVVEFCPPIFTAELERSEKKQLGVTCKAIMEEAMLRNQSLL